MNEQPARLQIDEPGAGKLRLRGEIDLHTADALQERLKGMGSAEDVELDMADVQFIDSSGLRVIIRSHQDHESAGTRLVLSKPSEVVVKLLAITGLTERLHINDAPDG